MASGDVATFLIRAQDETKAAINSAKAGMRSLTTSAEGLQNTLRGISRITFGYLGVQQLQLMTTGLIQARIEAERFRNVLELSTGAQGLNLQVGFVKDLANRVGTEFVTTGQSFAKFSAATRGTQLEGDATKKVFEQVAKATAAMGLTVDDTAGVFKALEQVVSKGKVQAEELRGQMGDRLPGAFQIAARAMGVTTAELDKMLENGEVFATQFLPKFADQLEKEIAGTTDKVANSTQASVNRLVNSWTELKQAIAQGPVGDRAVEGIKQITSAVSDLSVVIENLRRGGGISDIKIGETELYRSLFFGDPNTIGEARLRRQDLPAPPPDPAADRAKLNKIELEAEAGAVRASRDSWRDLEKKYEDVSDKARKLRSEIASIGVQAGKSPQEIARLQQAAIDALPKTDTEKLQNKINELRDKANKAELGPVQALVAEFSREKGITPALLKEVEAIGKRIEAGKRLAEWERQEAENREAFISNVLQKEKARGEALKKIEDDAGRVQLEAELYAAGSVELKKRIALYELQRAGIVLVGDEMERYLGLIEATEKTSRLNELLKATDGARFGQFEQDKKLIQERFDQTGDLAEYGQLMGEAEKQTKEYRDSLKDAQDAARDFGQVWTSMFEDALFGGEKLSTVLKALAVDMAKLILRQELFKPFQDMLVNDAKAPGGGSNSTWFSALIGLFGQRAGGGAVDARSPYIVGEQGPELFFPGRSGTVIPNNRAGMGGGALTINQQISIGQGADQSMIFAAVAAANERTKADILASRRRGGAFA